MSGREMHALARAPSSEGDSAKEKGRGNGDISLVGRRLRPERRAEKERAGAEHSPVRAGRDRGEEHEDRVDMFAGPCRRLAVAAENRRRRRKSAVHVRDGEERVARGNRRWMRLSLSQRELARKRSKWAERGLSSNTLPWRIHLLSAPQRLAWTLLFPSHSHRKSLLRSRKNFNLNLSCTPFNKLNHQRNCTMFMASSRASFLQ